MCDYSLHVMPNRLAEEGEVLTVHRFPTGSKGLTSPEYLKPREQAKRGLIAMVARMLTSPVIPQVCAVCIPDGARLLLAGISPVLQRAHHISAIEMVTFRQLALEAGIHRDAVEFGNGITVLVQDLEEGQNIEVVALSSEKTGVREEEVIRADV
jgi:hypothetical protein